MNKKLNSNSSAGTTADSDKTPKIPMSSHACSNTFVVRSPNVEAAENEVVYDTGDELPPVGSIVINRDKGFIPVSHIESIGEAVRWIRCETPGIDGSRGTMWALLDD